ncbi:hypothetical protein JCM5350_002903 [Sporobolomyces pararoseus]
MTHRNERHKLYDPPPPTSTSTSSQTRSRSQSRARTSSKSRSRSNSLSHSDSRSKSQRRRSIPETLENAFEGVQNVAERVEDGAEEVKKWGRTGEEIVRVVDREFPQLREIGGDEGSARETNRRRESEKERRSFAGGGGESTAGEDGSASEDEQFDNRPLLDKRKPVKVVPYQSPTSRTDSLQGPVSREQERRGNNEDAGKRADSVDLLREEIDSTQERVDNLFTLLETIATSRYQLTGATYHLQHLLVEQSRPTIPLIDSSDPRRQEKHMKSLVRNTTSAKQDLLKAYSEICALSPRYNKLVPQVEDTKKRKLAREFSTLASTFAKLLDFVEDRSAEESEEDREGRRDQRMMKRFEESEPGWDEGKRLRELKKVKEEAKELSFDKLDVTTWTGKWLVDNPFRELDRTAISEIDRNEKQKTSRGTGGTDLPSQTPKDDRWGFGSLFSNIVHSIPGLGENKHNKSDEHVPTRVDLEMGHRSRSSRPRPRRRKAKPHRYHELSHQASDSSRRSKSSTLVNDHFLEEGISTDSNEATDVEKQRRGLIPLKKTQTEIELDSTEIPYQVPSDDTSGYQETPEELRMDQKARIETEHFWTPIVMVEWILIVVMILYWGITRGIGYHNPLGDISLGRIVGNDAWSDTAPTIVSNSTSSSTSLSLETLNSTSSTLPVSSSTTSPLLTKSTSTIPSSIRYGVASSESSQLNELQTTIPARTSYFSSPTLTADSKAPSADLTTTSSAVSTETTSIDLGPLGLID